MGFAHLLIDDGNTVTQCFKGDAKGQGSCSAVVCTLLHWLKFTPLLLAI